MEFDSRINEMSGALIESTQELIRIRSVEEQEEDGRPFGKGVHACLEHCLTLSERLGFRVQNVDNMLGYCEYGEGDEMIAVLGHLDVVPEGDGWKFPPYGAEIHNGRIYGRGAVDDKGPTVAALYALEAIKASGVPLSRRIRVLFGLNEETGSTDVRHYVQQGGEIPVMGFTPDGEYPIINGEKGIVTSTCRKTLVRKGQRSIRSIRGGTAPNVVPDYACAELSCPADFAETACRVQLEQVKVSPIAGGVKVEAYGVSAHGSTPEKGENAIGRLLLALGILELDGDSKAFVDFMNARIGMETRGKSLGVALNDEISGDLTLNLGVIDGGENGITVKINVRYPVTCKLDDYLVPQRAAFSAAGFEEVAVTHKDSLYMPPDCELIRKLSKVYEEQTGEPARLVSIGGGTYAKAIPNIVAFGPIFPGDEEVEHKPDEYIEISKLIKNAKIIAAAMYELAK